MFITKNMFIYLIYLGLPILGRVIPTAYGTNYCSPVTFCSPIIWEVDNHTRTIPYSLWTVRGFFNIPQNFIWARVMGWGLQFIVLIS